MKLEPVREQAATVRPTDAWRPADPSSQGDRRGYRQPTYAALDLGTNNCRLLIARRSQPGFRVVDAFSRIVRLGEGLSQTGRLGEPAIRRTIDALAVCRDKMSARGVDRFRLIATEACRSAANGGEFLHRVREETGLELEIVDRETEALLAAEGCAALADPAAKGIVLFDIGGGSSEIVWLGRGGSSIRNRVKVWASMKLGVVSLAERFGGQEVSPAVYEAMIAYVRDAMSEFVVRTAGEARCENFHLLGTSGTVTTVAGIHLGLTRYDRRRVDGLWLDDRAISEAINLLRGMTFAERSSNGCIGHERADLVLAGCAILDAIRAAFPSQRIRIADRGLREGILTQLMADDTTGRGGRHGPR